MVQKTFGIYGDINHQMQLVIELGKQHFSCWQTQNSSEKIYSFELFQFEKNKDENFSDIFRNIKNQSKLLAYNYTDVNIIWENEDAVIIPKQFAGEENEKKFLKLVSGNSFNSNTCTLTEGDLNISYYINQEWQNIILMQFSSYEGRHKYCVLVSKWLEEKRNSGIPYVCISLYPKHFILTAFLNEDLLLINTFTYQIPEDVLYHILNVCERLQLNKEEVHFSFAGLIDVESNLFKTLESYLRNIFFIIPSPGILAAKDFENYPAHYFSSFLNVFP